MGEILRQDTNEPQTPSLRPEHLAEGYRPIMACVGDISEYDIDDMQQFVAMRESGSNVHFFGNPKELHKQGLKTAGRESYVISHVDEELKFTDSLINCTALVAVGRDKDTQKEISFLTHQNPVEFLAFSKDCFTKDLKEQIKELERRCVDGSIDIVIAGGNLRDENPSEYERSLNLLSSVVKEECGFEPQVICGPKDEAGKDFLYFDTEKRRLYVIRPDKHLALSHNEPFQPSGIGDLKDGWKERRRQYRKQKDKPTE